ncbi:Probable Co/Zn/Cd efflux system membrane fusion protein [hydrothermal vent metagenome]|uniref:Probable Co/Zn/Cd efflux system membrane fusion protein n=1 Tax=hydrothermal vent metagenome TaxID=652676 RepID=A0A3B1CKM9_9ZZZZ
MSKKILTYGLLLLVGLILGAGGYSLFQSGNSSSENGESSSEQTASGKESSKRKVLYWRAPMNPKEIYNHPGKSNMGMDLVPVYADASGESGTVSIDPVMQQDMNVKIALIKEGQLNPEIFTNGILQPDEQKEYIATTKVAGWIDKLYINYTGKKVRKGEKLVKIYSPELVAAQEEYLTALAYDRAVNNSENNSTLINNAIRKLELLDVTKDEIKRLHDTQEVTKYITLYSPISGTVIYKGIEEGAKINRGTPLLKIADLSNLWILADIYEYEASKVKLGLTGKVTFDYLPGKSYTGKISFIYPTLDTKTRTLKVRFDLPNRNGELKPGMFANVDIKTESDGTFPLVPEQAVLRSGKQNTVIIALGEGRFKPAQIELGEYANGFYQVLGGISANTKIVTSAQFLIDSESNLRASVEMFNGADDSSETSETDMSNMDMSKDETTDNSQMDMSKDETDHSKMDMSKKDESEVIRKGVIDVESIDKNKDGILYQDIMDWNVISDKEGECPLCGMQFRKMTIEQVKKNLKEHGFEYK